MVRTVPALLSLALVLAATAAYADAANVLMYLPISTPSHKNVFLPVARGLAGRGHHVVMVTSVPADKGDGHSHVDKADKDEGSFDEILVDAPDDFLGKVAKDAADPSSNAFSRMASTIWNVRQNVHSSHSMALTHPRLKSLLDDPDTRFDLTFVFPLFNEVGYFLAERFNSSLVLFMPAVANNALTIPMGYFDNPSFATPSVSTPGQSPGFAERFFTFTLYNLYGPVKKLLLVGEQEQLLQDLGLTGSDGGEGQRPDRRTADLLELELRANFGMYFTHLLFDSVRPTLPNTIDIGAIQCRPPRELPAPLALFLTSSSPSPSLASAHSDPGTILVSFGSWLNADDLPEGKMTAIMNVLARLPQKVVMKRDVGNVKKDADSDCGLASNIRTAKWLPQQDILGHNSTRLFITQGGMLSIQESLYHKVPILVIPVFGDQQTNGLRAVRDGYGKVLELEDLTEERLFSHVHEILSEPRYAERAAHFSRLLRDDIQTPLERAIFWSEYVIRHKGAGHMRSPAAGLSFVAFFQVDILAVWAAILAAILAVQAWVLWKMGSWIVKWGRT